MATQLQPASRPEIVYPESDGQPMADNTLQFRWIVTLKGGLDAVFRGDPDVFVAGDLLWYPVEGNNQLRVAPDVLVVFGRPKGDRGSYLQWREENVPPQVVFEILSPGNRLAEMGRKLDFYERHGVEEYYLIDPQASDFTGWLRQSERLRPIESVHNWISPRLGIRFELTDGDLAVFGPDGRRFTDYVEVVAALEEATAELNRERQERQRAEIERERAEDERDQARRHAERLAEKLREMGIDPDAG